MQVGMLQRKPCLLPRSSLCKAYLERTQREAITPSVPSRRTSSALCLTSGALHCPNVLFSLAAIITLSGAAIITLSDVMIITQSEPHQVPTSPVAVAWLCCPTATTKAIHTATTLLHHELSVLSRTEPAWKQNGNTACGRCGRCHNISHF